jgi:hypothetical protein
MKSHAARPKSEKRKFLFEPQARQSIATHSFATPLSGYDSDNEYVSRRFGVRCILLLMVLIEIMVNVTGAGEPILAEVSELVLIDGDSFPVTSIRFPR